MNPVASRMPAMWLLEAINRDFQAGEKFSLHPNYPAWIAALKEAGRSVGYDKDPEIGATPGYVNAIVSLGFDSDTIKSVYSMLFCAPYDNTNT